MPDAPDSALHDNASRGGQVRSDHQQVHWILGLPFDCLTLHEAAGRIRDAVAHRTRLVFATPNVNFLAETSRHPAFLAQILRTQLSLADGFPVVRLGRALGAPVPMRVAGSSLLDLLRHDQSGPPIRVFFFGGDPGMARAAHEALARADGPLVAAGWHDPGFVPVEAMSTPAIIDAINHAAPDFIVVALGARKGHDWIDRNASRLAAPVISHLGAAVGFVAGELRRAPQLVQAAGLEWLWRCAMEPRLFSRYARDGVFLVRTAASRALPLALRRRTGRDARSAALQMERAVDADGRASLTLRGSLLQRDIPRLLEQLPPQPGGPAVLIDLTRVSAFDSASLGCLYALRFRSHAVMLTCQQGTAAWRSLGAHNATCLVSS